MAVEPSALRRELIGFAGIVERNVYLIRRFAWWEVAWFLYTVANTLTIVFIAKGVEAAGGQLDVNEATIVLLIGAVIWSYLGLIFEIVTETVAWERWEGTIEYTFMAPLTRATHLLGTASSPSATASFARRSSSSRSPLSSGCTCRTRISSPQSC